MTRPNLPWRTLLLGTSAAVGALLVDQLIGQLFAREALRRAVEQWLGALLGAGPVIVLLAILASFRNRWRLWAGFLAPVLVSTAVLHLSKWAIGRARPRLGLGAFHFDPFSAADLCDGFPSGHAVSAGTLALLLGIYFPRARWVFYVLAGVAGLERIITGWHFLSDVIAGYVLAGLVVFGCVRLLGRGFYRRGLSASPD